MAPNVSAQTKERAWNEFFWSVRDSV